MDANTGVGLVRALLGILGWELNRLAPHAMLPTSERLFWENVNA